MVENVNNPTAHGKLGRQPAKRLFEDGTYDLNTFHDVFIELEDPTEYKPAMQLVGSWMEWNRLKRDWPTFNDRIAEWKEELEVKLKSKAIQHINDLAFKVKNYQANKWLAEEGYNRRQGAGRPTKAEKTKQAKELANQAADTQKDKARVLKLINGD